MPEVLVVKSAASRQKAYEDDSDFSPNLGRSTKRQKKKKIVYSSDSSYEVAPKKQVHS